MTIDVTQPENEPIIIMTRLLDAPIDLVWEVFTQAEHMVHWWGGHGWSNPVCDIDLRVGGKRNQVMRSPDGFEMALKGVFLEIDKPHHLVWRNESDDPARPPVIQAVTLTEEDGKTRWTLRSTMVSVAARNQAAAMGFVEMITQGSERLDGYLASLQTA